MEEDKEYPYEPSVKSSPVDQPAHYYGDTVRSLFLAGAIILLITTGVYRNTFDMPVSLSFLGSIILVLFAGLTMYKQWVIIFFDVVISIISTIFFEYLVLYGSHNRDTLLFWIYQLLAIIFLCALYYSVKTLRNNIVR